MPILYAFWFAFALWGFDVTAQAEEAAHGISAAQINDKGEYLHRGELSKGSIQPECLRCRFATYFRDGVGAAARSQRRPVAARQHSEASIRWNTPPLWQSTVHHDPICPTCQTPCP